MVSSAATTGTAGNGSTIAENENWRKLHGDNSWSGLLDPLDLDLRKSIISYGELVSAALDAFNSENRSPHAGDCMFDTTDLLSRSTVTSAAAGEGNSYYRVTKLIYATAAERAVRDAFLVLPNAAIKVPVWSRDSNFMGYVAVATDDGAAALGRRDIVVVWRGTAALDWLKNDNDDDALVALAPALGLADSGSQLGSVNGGFLSLYTSSSSSGDGSEFNKTSARDQVLDEVRKLVQQYKDDEATSMSITVAGHSLGAALATLNAVDMVANGVNVQCPVTAIVFASPRVGDESFAAAFRSFGDDDHQQQLRALHVKNGSDEVTMYPAAAKGYPDDVAVTVPVDPALSSPYLRSPATQETLHDLECYLHGVAAGEQGMKAGGGGFRMEVERDEALVNKHADGLKDECHVPASWWVVQNKSMVKNAKEKWELKDFE